MKHFTILFIALIISCTVSNEAELNGAWKYVSGSYESNDFINKTTSDDINSIKIYTDNRYSVITQITAEDNFLPIADRTPWKEIHIQNFLSCIQILIW